MLSPQERSLSAKAAAHAMHAAHDSKVVSQPARDAFLRRFEHSVDPEGKLSEAERVRRAKHALKAHMVRLALKSAQARRKAAS